MMGSAVSGRLAPARAAGQREARFVGDIEARHSAPITLFEGMSRIRFEPWRGAEAHAARLLGQHLLCR